MLLLLVVVTLLLVNVGVRENANHNRNRKEKLNNENRLCDDAHIRENNKVKVALVKFKSRMQ